MSEITEIRVGTVIPGYCGGVFPLRTDDGMGLRVEAIGADWVVLRDFNGGVHFFDGGEHRLLEAVNDYG